MLECQDYKLESAAFTEGAKKAAEEIKSINPEMRSDRAIDRAIADMLASYEVAINACRALSGG